MIHFVDNMPELPIRMILPELCAALAQKRVVILSAPPGSGKTTGVPLALLKEEWLSDRSILILEPRRLAARMAASRMAVILQEPVGAIVGYRVRMDSRISAATRIEVLTEGILTRRLQGDPALEGVGLVIFDEFHERSIHADLALALCLEVMHGLRPDLKVLIMSATLDIEALVGFLYNPGVIIGAGQGFPVVVRYMEEPERGNRYNEAKGGPYLFGRLIEAMVAVIRLAAGEEKGDILAFLPGKGEIRQVGERLASWAAEQDIVIRPLYGDLPAALQDQAVLPDPTARRRIVLTTSVAETSLTIEGVRVVIDSGFRREPRFDPNSGLSRLITVRVSRSAAEQRAGRAGRLEPGVCYRLWNKGLDRDLLLHSRPEILETDLAQLALELAFWGVSEPAALAWLDLPPPGHYAQAVALLTLLGALDDHGRITPLGKRMAGLPVHPRLGRMLIVAEESGDIGTACDLAALLSERDIMLKSDGLRSVDLEARLQILSAYRNREEGLVPVLSAEASACARVDQAARQWLRLFQKKGGRKPEQSAGSLLVHAYPDRVAKLRPGFRDRYRLANGRGALLPAGEQLSGSPYLVAAQLDAGQVEGRIYLAAAITEAELFEIMAGHINTTESVGWDPKLAAVTACREVRLGELLLTSRQVNDVAPEAIRAAMLEGVRSLGLEALPWTDEARAFQARVLSLRFWQLDDVWPDISDAALTVNLASWLGPHLTGITRCQHLARLDLVAILRHLLDWNMQRRLDEEAPTHLSVPSGSRLRLLYSPGKPPVLMVRLQEMFGLADTPVICRGRVQVMLHLQSPARRPIQVTMDLRGFWNRTYQEVKKELQGRYPKHHWPDDPWSAEPTARARSRSRK